MSERKANILREFDTAWGELLLVVRQINEENAQRKTPNGEWTVRDCLAHLAGTMADYEDSMARLLNGTNSLEILNRRNEERLRERAGKSVAELKQELEAEHAQVRRYMERLPESELDREGRTAAGQPQTVEQRLLRAGAHYREHLGQMQEGLAR